MLICRSELRILKIHCCVSNPDRLLFSLLFLDDTKNGSSYGFVKKK